MKKKWIIDLDVLTTWKSKTFDEGWKLIDKEMYSLIEEAKKYKSADEFIKAQWDNYIYHWTSKEIKWDFKWWYFTDNPKYAEIYKSQSASSLPKSKEFYLSENKPGIYKTKLNPKEIFDINNPENKKIFNKYLETDSVSWPWYWISEKWLIDWTEWENLKTYLDENYPWKFKWIKLDEWWMPWKLWKVENRWISYSPINPNEIKLTEVKTKSQLQDIYNQAHKK